MLHRARILNLPCRQTCISPCCRAVHLTPVSFFFFFNKQCKLTRHFNYQNTRSTEACCFCPLLTKVAVQESRCGAQLIISVFTSLVFMKACCKRELTPINRWFTFPTSRDKKTPHTYLQSVKVEPWNLLKYKDFSLAILEGTKQSINTVFVTDEDTVKL